MISKFFTTTFTGTRGAWLTDGDGFPYSSPSAITSFKGHLQQATPRLAQYLNLNYTKTFTVWVAVGTDIKQGDMINDGTYYYSVKEIQDNSFVGSNKHLELVVERSEEVGS